MKRLSKWLSVLVFGCVFVFAFPAAGASGTFPGAFDPSFGSGGTVVTTAGLSYPSISASVLQPDGKIVLVGHCSDSEDISQPNPPQVLVARLTTDGSLDPSFGAGGVVAVQVGLGASPQSYADSLVLQSDGKIVVGGWATDALNNLVFMVARLNADGSFDSAFGTGGTVTESSLPGVSALALESAGKIVGAGNGFVARLNPDGSFDTSFASDGVQPIQANLAAVALQPDGKVVAAGNEASVFLVARLNAAGSLDTTFGSNGIAVRQLGAGQDPSSFADSVLVQPDGKIVAGGSCTDSNSRPQLLVARLDSNGDPDSSFGSGGTVITQLSDPDLYPSSYVNALALQPNGKILAAGTANDVGYIDDAFVVRLQANGSFDTSFGTGGNVSAHNRYSGFTTMTLQPDGKVVAAGWAALHYGSLLVAARLIVDLPPTATFSSSPDPPTAGQSVTFNGNGSSDTDGSIIGYAWSFGDGGTAGGSTRTHAFAASGSYTVTLTVTDDYGLTNSVSHTIRVVRPPAPILTLLRLRPHTFKAAAHGGSIARQRGTTVSYRDSLAARTRFTVDRILAGKVRGPVRGSFAHQDRKGTNSFHFTGRLGSQRLRPGSYRLNATPTVNGKTGATTHITFSITH